MDAAVNLGEIMQILCSGSYRLGTERILQDDVEKHLLATKVPHKREYILGPGERVDFLIYGFCAVELKMRANKRSIIRQLERYALHDVVKAIVLVSNTPLALPPLILGKPTRFISLGRLSL